MSLAQRPSHLDPALRLHELERTLAMRERELAVLSSLAARVHAEETREGILDVTLEEVLDKLGLRAAWVFLGDEGHTRLELVAQRGVAPEYLEDVRLHGLGTCLCPEVFRGGQPREVRTTLQCPRMPGIVAGLNEPVAHACVPLTFEGQRRGVLNVAAQPGGSFSEEQLRFLETVGHQTCIAMERAAHLHAERCRNEEARAMAAVTKAIGGSLDVAAVLAAVGSCASEAIGAERVQILLGADPTRLVVAYLSGRNPDGLAEGQTVDLAAGRSILPRRSLEQRCLLRFEEPTSAAAGGSRGLTPDVVMAVPLVARERGLGLILLSRRGPLPWAEQHAYVAEALASQAAVALENARLYAEACSAYQDLKDAQQRIVAAEKMAVLGTFASGLAHEVRNPLNSIGLQLSILERRLARLRSERPAELGEVVGVIREEIKRLDNLVGDFLLFSRTNRLQHQLADVDGLIDDVMRLLGPEAEAAGVLLRREQHSRELPQIRMDAEKMRQVIINLVRNAIEAMPDGGLVTVSSGFVGGRAQIVVRDSGPGLPEGLDVFQLFVTTKAKGTGLGLSIAQQIVLEHGGEIGAESRPGQGACFTVSLRTKPPEGRRQEDSQS